MTSIAVLTCPKPGDSYDSSRRFGGSEAGLEIGLVLGFLEDSPEKWEDTVDG